MQLIPNSSANIDRLSGAQTEMPSYTYRLDWEAKRVRGFIDDEDAMKQAISKILMTWQHAHIIYSASYGLEARGLVGHSIAYIATEIERRITEALMVDRRILRVYQFRSAKGERPDALLVSFVVVTRFGEYNISDMEVAFT